MGDEIGSALIAATLVRDLIQLGFLIERRYAPYSKWFGTAFAELQCASTLLPLFQRSLAATSWREREAPLTFAYEQLAMRFNELGVAHEVDPTARDFYSRPFKVLQAGRFVDAVDESITSPEIRTLINRAGWIGGIDQITDNVDLKTGPDLVSKLRTLFA